MQFYETYQDSLWLATDGDKLRIDLCTLGQHFLFNKKLLTAAPVDLATTESLLSQFTPINSFLSLRYLPISLNVF